MTQPFELEEPLMIYELDPNLKAVFKPEPSNRNRYHLIVRNEPALNIIVSGATYKDVRVGQNIEFKSEGKRAWRTYHIHHIYQHLNNPTQYTFDITVTFDLKAQLKDIVTSI